MRWKYLRCKECGYMTKTPLASWNMRKESFKKRKTSYMTCPMCGKRLVTTRQYLYLIYHRIGNYKELVLRYDVNVAEVGSYADVAKTVETKQKSLPTKGKAKKKGKKKAGEK